ncbi:hypothetical protein H103_02473 [Trichophyton rubrum CBS 288.86]|uniref:Uncharacterized protein n=1 Tax=Trichophyton rubrum CBS 288.86 TaxID=1215330 RepID=A0A022W927_TRIRU|nr:hypothetical protein H103_02473 [Trichophyton rubrum CBS 288.86]EZF86790.1 hypothetical protein H110_02470 [Trichophyton rubrum MR1448]
MKSYNAVKSDYDLQKDARRDADYLCQVDRRQVDRHEKEEKTAHPRAHSKEKAFLLSLYKLRAASISRQAAFTPFLAFAIEFIGQFHASQQASSYERMANPTERMGCLPGGTRRATTSYDMRFCGGYIDGLSHVYPRTKPKTKLPSEKQREAECISKRVVNGTA